MHRTYDVVILGGGPGGSTTGCFLKKYKPELSVLIVEKERFPRDHVGESQLPPISAVLDEIGAWDKVERADFPVKIGATFTWGRTTEPWVFEFLPISQVPDKVQRPGTFTGWRKQCAFQVDRSIYDKILLEHAAEMGCEVRQGTPVESVLRTGDRVDGIVLAGGERVEGRMYVDATGNAAILRRAMGIEVEVPTALKNVAFWDYWENPAWAAEPERDATRIHIRSVGFGWIWFIPLSRTRTSIGLVCNAEFYKSSGRSYESLYYEALDGEAFVKAKLQGATSRKSVVATTDWSFVVERTVGENWFLVGECAGFADPILSAGLTLTQTGARDLAYTILELERGDHDRTWLLEHYDELQRRRVRQHMRFAEFWYSANGIFENVRENCVKIAAESGLEMDPAKAFHWIATGGLGDDAPGQVGIGGYDVAFVKQMIQMFTGSPSRWQIDGKNVFRLNLANAREERAAVLREGRIETTTCYVRGGRRLVMTGVQAALVRALRKHSDAGKMMEELTAQFSATLPPAHVQVAMHHSIQTLEVLANDYWVTCAVDKKRPLLEVKTPEEGVLLHHVKLPLPGSK